MMLINIQAKHAWDMPLERLKTRAKITLQKCACGWRELWKQRVPKSRGACERPSFQLKNTHNIKHRIHLRRSDIMNSDTEDIFGKIFLNHALSNPPKLVQDQQVKRCAYLHAESLRYPFSDSEMRPPSAFENSRITDSFPKFQEANALPLMRRSFTCHYDVNRL